MGLQKGDKVRVKPSVQNPKYGWGSVTRDSVGVLISIESSQVTIDFPEQSGWSADPDEIESIVQSSSTTQAAPATVLKSGDRVRVKASVTNPRNGWGKVTKTSVGLVKTVNKQEAIVDFPEQSDWPALPSELEVVTTTKGTQQKKAKPAARKKHEGAVVKPDQTSIVFTSIKDGPIVVGSSSELLITVGKDSNDEPLSVSVRGPMMPGPMEVVDNEDGTLSVCFTCRTMGKYEFDLCWGFVPLKESPFVVDVVNMVVNDPTKVTIEPVPTEGFVDVQIPLNISVAAGAGSGPPVITHVSGPAEPSSIECAPSVAGKYFGNVTYSKAGTYKLQIGWGDSGSNIASSPFEIKVEASRT